MSKGYETTLPASTQILLTRSAGWEALVNAEKNPTGYQPTDDLFTADRSQIYGALTSSPGHRYGSEINGTRVSGWS